MENRLQRCLKDVYKRQVYGVVGIVIKKHPLAMFENSILLSILGECALALENEKNAWRCV